MTPVEQNWAHEYLDANELGLALEMITDWLSEDSHTITAAERDTMLGLVDEMGMDDRVARALALCPIAHDAASDRWWRGVGRFVDRYG